MLAGMEKSTEFYEKRETCIWKKYNADEIGQRWERRSWIKEPYDPYEMLVYIETMYQGWKVQLKRISVKHLI